MTCQSEPAIEQAKAKQDIEGSLDQAIIILDRAKDELTRAKQEAVATIGHPDRSVDATIKMQYRKVRSLVNIAHGQVHQENKQLRGILADQLALDREKERRFASANCDLRFPAYEQCRSDIAAAVNKF